MKRAKHELLFLALLLLAALLRFPLISSAPLYMDEAVYAEMITELMHNPLQIIPHYLGNPVSWKPPVAFYSYAAVIAPVSFIFPSLPPEFIFRAAPAFFAALSIFVLYFLLREFFDAQQAFFASLIFALANQALTSTNVLLLDSALLFFILLALFAYAKSLKSASWLIPAAIFSMLAAFTKTYVALAIPISAFALYYYLDKRKLKSSTFIASLLSVPTAMFIYAALYSLMVPGGLRDIASSYIYDSVARMDSAGILRQLASNSIDLFSRMFPWGLLSIAGAALLVLKKPEDKFLALWSAISLVPLLSSTGFFWYYLPAVPPLSALAARALSRLNATHACALIMALALFSLALLPQLDPTSPDTFEQKQAGISLQGKQNILCLTQTGVPAILYYKFQGEKSPDYPAAKQIVAEPFGLESYTAFKTMAELVFDYYPRNNLSNATPEYVSSLIAQDSPDAVLMDKQAYEIYSQQPLQNYALTFTSSNSSFFIIERLG